MNSSRKKAAIILIPILIVSLFVITLLITPSTPPKNPYPILKTPPLMTLASPESVDEIADIADTIFVGEIIRVMDPVNQEIKTGNDSPEELINQKTNNSDNSVEIYPVEVLITDTMKGAIEKGKKVTVYRSSMTVNYEPEMKEGTKMVFVTNYNDFWKGYVAVHPHAGYFYVTDKNIVYPAFRSKAFDKTTGIQLEKLVSKLR